MVLFLHLIYYFCMAFKYKLSINSVVKKMLAQLIKPLSMQLARCEANTRKKVKEKYCNKFKTCMKFVNTGFLGPSQGSYVTKEKELNCFFNRSHMKIILY